MFDQAEILAGGSSEFNIDYSEGWSGLVDWVPRMFRSENLTSQNFPLERGKTGVHRVTVKLVCFGRSVTEEEVQDHFAANNLLLPMPEHLFVFGCLNRKFEFPVVAVLREPAEIEVGGRVNRFGLSFISSQVDPAGCQLLASWLGLPRDGRCRYLAVVPGK